MTVPVNIFMNAAATAGYAHTSQLSQVTLNNEEVSMATRGMTFTQPDWLADGLNPISGGNYGGILNLNGKYNDEGLPPQATTSWVA